MSTLERRLLARRFALAAHGDQRYGDLPYEYHLEKCQEVRRRFVTLEMLEASGVSEEELEQAVWLHDVVEDTPATREMVEVVFGKVVADMVWAVSECEYEPGKKPNRHRRHWGMESNPGYYRKIPHVRGAALLLKLLDRIANVEASAAAAEKLPPHKRKKSLLGMYADEQPEFYETLYQPGPLQPLWDHLNEVLEFQP